MHSTQTTNYTLTLGPFLRLLLTMPGRQAAIGPDVSNLSEMGEPINALARSSMTVSTSKRVGNYGVPELVFRLVSSEG